MLMAIALLLLAGVILYTVFSEPIDRRENVTPYSATTEVATTNSTTTTLEVTTTSAQAPSSTVKKKVNINTADIDELMTVKGIGKVKAQAIIDYRNTYGPFASINALCNVKGIGPKTVQKIAEMITVD